MQKLVCLFLLLMMLKNNFAEALEVVKEPVEDPRLELIDILLPQNSGIVDIEVTVDWHNIIIADTVINSMMETYISTNCEMFMGTNLEFNLCMDSIYNWYELIYNREMACIGYYGKNENIVRAKSFDKSWQIFFKISSLYKRLYSHTSNGREQGMIRRWNNIHRMKDIVSLLRNECESVNGGIRYNYKFDHPDFNTLKPINPSEPEDSQLWRFSIKVDLEKFNYLAPLPIELKSLYGRTKNHIIQIYSDIDGKHVLNMWNSSEINENGYFLRGNAWSQFPNVIARGSRHEDSIVFMQGDVSYIVTVMNGRRELLIKTRDKTIKEKFIFYRSL